MYSFVPIFVEVGYNFSIHPIIAHYCTSLHLVLSLHMNNDTEVYTLVTEVALYNAY